MKTIQQTYHINAPIEKVWQALVDPQIIEVWSSTPAVMDEKEGSEFELWNGDIHGKNKEVVKNKKLVQEWYGGKWDEPSIVTFTLSEENGKTTIELLHENVPDSEVKDIDDGWNRYYLGEIKKLLED